MCIIFFLLLIAKAPRTTTKICAKCSSFDEKFNMTSEFGFRNTTEQMCAISDKNENEFDACRGDSGGKIVDVYL